MAGMFYGCASLETIDLSCLNTSKVRSMLGLFQECTALTSVNLSGLDTSSLTDTGKMFDHCSSLKTVDISDLDTAGVTSMTEMFHGCSSLTSIDLSLLDFSSVENMTYMLAGCTQLKSVNLADVNSAKAEYLTGMFYGCSSLEGIDLTGLDTSSAVSFENMFRDCTKLKSADLTPLKTSHVTTLDKMFEDCKDLESVDMSNFDTSASLSTQAMFTACPSLKTIMVSAGLAERLGGWFPNAPSDNGWWSWEAQGWFTPSDIAQSRGQIADMYTATPVYNIKNAVVSVVDQTFTGSKITPTPTVEFAQATLQEGVDYTVEHRNNVNAGVAEVVITGMGSYKGTASKEFRINRASINTAAVSGVSDQTYTGRAIEPNLRVALQGYPNLVRGTDYTVKYENNLNVGTAKVIIVGTGNYTDVLTRTFKINPARITAASGAARTYNGKAQTTAWTVKAGGLAVPAAGFSASGYKANTNAGTASATITGRGNFTGSVLGVFQIKPLALSIAAPGT